MPASSAVPTSAFIHTMNSTPSSQRAVALSTARWKSRKPPNIASDTPTVITVATASRTLRHRFWPVSRNT